MSEDKKVIINIVDSHESDGENSTSELITVGTLNGFGDNYSLAYTEQDESLFGAVTTLRVENKNRIVLTRTGEFGAEIITPHGEFMMGIFARNIQSRMEPDGGELNFSYTIDFNTGFASTNELKVTVKEVKEPHVPIN